MGASDVQIEASAPAATPSQLQDIIDAQRALVSAASDPERVMALAVDLARRISGGRTAGLYVREGEWMVRRAASGYADSAPLRLSTAASLTGLCVRGARPLLCIDAETDPRVDSEVCRKHGYRSIALAPLVCSRGAEGALVVSSERAGAFNLVDTNLLEMLAGVVGAALEVSSLLQQAHDQNVETRSALDESNRVGGAHRLLFEANPTPMWIYDPRTFLIERANAAALALYGYAAGEFVGQSLFMLHLPADHARLRNVLSSTTTGDRSASWQHLRKDGAVRNVKLKSRNLDLDGRPQRLIIVKDVTARRRAERLQRLEQAVATGLAQAEGSAAAIETCIEAICSIAGWDCGSFWSLRPGGDSMSCVGAWGAKREGVVEFLEATRRVVHTPGEGGLVRRVWAGRAPVWIRDVTREASFLRVDLARAAALRAGFAFPVVAGAELVGVLEFFSGADLPPDSDLLDWSRSIGGQIGQFYQRTEAQERLRESEERYQDTIEVAPVGISHNDLCGRFTYVNRWTCDLLGYSREELLALSAQDVSHPEDREATVAARAKLYAGEIKSVQMEKRYLRKDGEAVWVGLMIALKRDAAGQPLRCISIMEDITPRKRAEEQLAATHNQLMQADKMSSVGQLAAGVAHEINNPIGYVYSNLGTLGKYLEDLLGMLDVYAEAEKDLPAASPALAALRRRKEQVDLPFLREDLTALMAESREGITRVKKIVQDLKDFSHADTKDEWQSVELQKGLESTLNIAHNEIKYKATVVKEYGELPAVRCLPSQLNQVFMNLMVNAAHAIEDKGTITLRTSLRGAEACVEISDTGGGIPKENLKRIFDPFFTTKPIGKGTGLGLSLSYGIVQKHGGRIEVESEIGKGTTFRILLPLCQSAPAA